MNTKIPNLKIIIALLFASTVIFPVVGITATIWFIGGYLVHRFFPFIAPIILYGAIGVAIVWRISLFFRYG